MYSVMKPCLNFATDLSHSSAYLFVPGDFLKDIFDQIGKKDTVRCSCKKIMSLVLIFLLTGQQGFTESIIGVYNRLTLYYIILQPLV